MAAGQNALRTGRGLGPQFERLREQDRLRQAVNPDSVRSYVYKRPDDVQWPDRSENSWNQLARALSRFVPGLDRMAAAKEQEFFEKQTALGMRIQHELEDNAVSWKAFVEKNPDYEGLNPHLERGYKMAQLNTLAREYAAAGEAFYQESNLAAAKDPDEVKRKLGEFQTAYIAKHITPLDVDADLYAKAFLPEAQRAEGELLERHTRNRAAENIAQSDMAWSENIDVTISTLFEEKASAEQMAERLAHDLKVMSSPMGGAMPLSRARAILSKALLQRAKAEGYDGYGEEVLDVASRIKTGTGTLGGTAEFKAAAKGIRQEWERERRRRQSEYQQQYLFNMRVSADNARKAVGAEVLEAYKNGKTLPDVDYLISLPGVGMDHVDVVQDVLNKFTGAAAYRPLNTLQNQTDYVNDLQSARLGELNTSDTGFLVAKYGRVEADRLLQIQDNAMSDGNPVAVALRGQDMMEARKMLKGQIRAHLTSMDMKDTDVVKAREIEAEQMLFDKAEVFINEFVQRSKRRPSDAEFREFLRSTALEIGKDPDIRNFDQPRDIRNPSAPQPKPQAAPEEMFSIKRRLENDAVSLFKMVEREPVKAFEYVRSRFPISTPEDFKRFMAAQYKAYGIDDPQRIKSALEEDARNMRRAETTERERFAASTGFYPEYMEEMRSDTELRRFRTK